ncbi:hypothetical protein GW17_00057807 [Ensete ventricosum]|nr:hypothetical protein GW17_00057807 [Ensete ventricosum]
MPESAADTVGRCTRGEFKATFLIDPASGHLPSISGCFLASLLVLIGPPLPSSVANNHYRQTYCAEGPSATVSVARNIDLVYGGGSVGLMGLVSQAVFDGGRHVLGSFSYSTWESRRVRNPRRTARGDNLGSAGNP